MFNWFQKNKRNLISANWDIGDIYGFKKIYNHDSLQYTNADVSKVIYFSVLKISGNNLFGTEAYAGDPTIIEDANGWLLKGSKMAKNQILVCVISVKKRDDVEWAKAFFDLIKFRENSN
ncbi:hypothetical protein HH214_16525 [Mucilaginibacter robiniae]|uniref:Uncharacterized protein n=1 Tax=Mucilaginibacter robiniae TaxID=2728022 RepID=A0A7L5E4Q7_9SPHI|nr:hypothetical protein [Mucilaginibacter robiniae]QJD97357.1 hypothetical protein HH214_16525 [Mucilaginibacter robiniae]